MRTPYEYAVIRVVPRVERGEQVNVGAVVYCRAKDYLCARIHLDQSRLRALDPQIDLDDVQASLRTWETVCDGTSPQPASRLPLGERFRWLTAPRSTIIQAGEVHAGLTDDPAAELTHLLDRLVR